MDDLPDIPRASHYPSHPPPVSLRLITTEEQSCAYLPNRATRTRAFGASEIPPELYHQFLDAGFRRSGQIVYQPICAGCRQCISLRVPVDRFAPNKSQRRCWRKNQDLRVTLHVPSPTEERHELYSRYRRHWHGAEDRDDWESFASFLYQSPVNTVEFAYRDAAGKLLGVSIADVCAQSLSSVYFYFDPANAARGLGTFSALWEIDWARRTGIPYYYLGYWVQGCAAMAYKANFRPYELLGTDGVWRVGEGNPNDEARGCHG